MRTTARPSRQQTAQAADFSVSSSFFWCRCHLALLQGIPKPVPSEENEVINELIREYLKYNNYRNTLSVMIPG